MKNIAMIPVFPILAILVAPVWIVAGVLVAMLYVVRGVHWCLVGHNELARWRNW